MPEERERPPLPDKEVPAAPPALPAKAPELVEFERLQKTLEDTRNIAIMRPTEANVRRYMELESQVVARASYFADVAQRVAWATPALDPTLQGRPVNAKALEVFEQQQLSERLRSVADLGREHVLIFFFRGDCAYCHAFAPTLAAFQARYGLRVEAVSVDGGSTQTIPGGPVASQIAIKDLGTNGGGFYNANSAHPFENPTTVSDLLEIWSLTVIPFALVVTFGRLVGDRRQARLLASVMVGFLVVMSALTMFAESNGNSALTARGVDQSISVTQSGGNMEGKEVRFGTSACGLYAAATTGTSNGSVNCMHDSFTPLGGLAPMVHMMLGEVSPGGVGAGLYGILVAAILAVFVAGLMVIFAVALITTAGPPKAKTA